MLGLGTLLGYQAAWGRLPDLSAVRAAEPTARATADTNKECCALPGRGQSFTAFGGKKEKEWQTPMPGNARGATTGPTDAPGHDHPNQYMFTKPTQIAPNMEPVIVHKKQLKEATDKLAKVPDLPPGRRRLA
jgi:hypothetical protein